MSFKANLVVSVFLMTASLLFSQDVSECFSTSSAQTICTATTQTPISMPGSGLTWGGHCSGVNEIWTNTIRTQNTGGLRFYAALSNDSAASANYNGSYIYTIFDDSFDLGSISIDVGQKASAQSIRWLLRDEQGDWYISSSAVSVGSSGAMSYIQTLNWLKVDAAATAFMNAQSSGATVGIADISTLQAASPDTSMVTGGGIYIEIGDTNSSASEYFVLNCITWGQFQELTLEQRVEALPEDTTPQKLKKALLQWALEDAQLDIDAGNTQAADITRADVEMLLDEQIGEVAEANTQYYPQIPEFSNNFIANSAVARMTEIRSITETYPRGQVPSSGIFDRALGQRMFLMAQAIGHPQSPLLADSLALKVMLRAMQRIYELSYEKAELDFFALPQATLTYLIFTSRYPDLILPSKKSQWEDAIERICIGINYTSEASQFGLLGITWVNRDVQLMMGLLSGAMILDNQQFAQKAEDYFVVLQQSIYPDGGFPYIYSTNESYNYHRIAPQQLMYQWIVAADNRARDLIEKGYWYYPLTAEFGPMGEYYTSPSWKQQWNLQDGSDGAYITASVTGSQDNYRIAMQGFNSRGTSSELYGNSDFFLASLYRSDLASRPAEDNYFVYDRNIMGPRGKFGRFSFGGTANLFSDNPPAEHISDRGMKTFVGCMIVNNEPGWSLNSGVAAAGARVRRRMGYAPDSLGEAARWDNYHAHLSRFEKSSSLVNENFAGLTTSYIPTMYRTDEIMPWQARQQWLYLPNGMIGMLSLEAIEQTLAYGMSVSIKTISGRFTWGTKKEFVKLDDNTYKYGELIVKVLDTDYYDIATEYASVAGDTANPNYLKAGRVLMRDQSESQADELWQQWVDGGKQGDEPSPDKTLYTQGTNRYAVVAIYPEYEQPVDAQRLELADGLEGFEVVSENGQSGLQKYRVIHNTTDTAITYEDSLDWQGSAMLHKSGEIYRPDWLGEYNTDSFSDFRQSPYTEHAEGVQVNPESINVLILPNTHIIITTQGDFEYSLSDFNKDGYVNMPDFRFLATDWNKCTEPYFGDCNNLTGKEDFYIAGHWDMEAVNATADAVLDTDTQRANDLYFGIPGVLQTSYYPSIVSGGFDGQGNALSFNAAEGNAAYFDWGGYDSMRIEFWFKPTVQTPSFPRQELFWLHDNLRDVLFLEGTYPTSTGDVTRLKMQHGNILTPLWFSIPYDGKWRHVVAEWGQDTAMLSVDGVVQTADVSENPFVQRSRELFVGRSFWWQTHTDRFYDGLLDEVKVSAPSEQIILTCGDWGYHTADLNNDCFVNIADLYIFASDWLN